MRIDLSSIYGVLYACLAASMSLPSRRISLVISALLVVFLILPILVKTRWHTINKRAALLVGTVICLTVLTLLNTFLLRSSPSGLFPLFFGLLNVVLLAIALPHLDPEKFMLNFAKTCIIIFFACLFLFQVGFDIFKNPNTYAFVLCPVMIYWIHIRKEMRWGLVATIVAVWLCILLEARLAMSLFILSYLLGFLSPRNAFYRISALVVFLSVVAANIYLTFNFDFVLNQILTNRVLIWTFYGDLISQNLLLGNGTISQEVSTAAAQRVSYFLERGANARYGTQSLYVLYLYQTGVAGLILIIALFTYTAINTYRFFWPVIIYYLAVSVETASIGVPSISGVPLTIFLLLALMERTKRSDHTL